MTDGTTYCGNCGEANPKDAWFCSGCGAPLQKPAESEAVEEGDGTGGIIPYKNPAALMAYYLGLFSLFPLLGLPLGIAALALGIAGLRRRRERPVIKGSVHAWIGIVLGGITTLLWGAWIVAIIAGIVAG